MQRLLAENKADKQQQKSISQKIADFKEKLRNDFLNVVAEAESGKLDFKVFYAKLESDILRHLDDLDGIKSSYVRDEKNYPTGYAMERDATQALPLHQRLKPGDLKIEWMNMLLRALNTLRGIDHALEVRSASPEKNERQSAPEGRKELIENLDKLLKKIFQVMAGDQSGKDEKLIQAHQEFNTGLVRVICKTGLGKGIKSVTDCKKLLLHYRDLASVIEPAKSMKTIVYDVASKITHTEIAHPITQKIDEQYKQIDDFVLKTKKRAFKCANEAFAELIKDDKRRLSAQPRKTFGPTAKNAYLVCNQFSRALSDGKIQKSEPLWTLRCGSMVYVGKGCTKQQIKAYTTAIVKQLKQAAAKKEVGKTKLHFNILITDTSLSENQHDMFVPSTKVIEESKFEWSHIPTNLHGCLTQPIRVAPSLEKLAKERKIFLGIPSDKAKRNRNGMEIFLLANEFGEIINVVFCASGQDRTGTMLEIALQFWMQRALDHQFKMKLELNAIAAMRALGCHNAMLASFASPGSPGMKKNSQADELFSKEVSEFFYRSSADTNKATPMDEEACNQAIGAQTPYRALEASTKEKMEQEDISQFISEVRTFCQESKTTDQEKIKILNAIENSIKTFNEEVARLENAYNEQKKIAEQVAEEAKKIINDEAEKLALSEQQAQTEVKHENQQASHVLISDERIEQLNKNLAKSKEIYDSASIKLKRNFVQEIAGKIKQIWDLGESKHAEKDQSGKADRLMDIINQSPSRHPTLSRAGSLLLKYQNEYPKFFKATQIDTRGAIKTASQKIKRTKQ